MCGVQIQKKRLEKNNKEIVQKWLRNGWRKMLDMLCMWKNQNTTTNNKKVIIAKNKREKKIVVIPEDSPRSFCSFFFYLLCKVKQQLYWNCY